MIGNVVLWEGCGLSTSAAEIARPYTGACQDTDIKTSLLVWFAFEHFDLLSRFMGTKEQKN